MKANIKITAMLMAMTIGTLAASAQSANRRTPHSSSERKTSSAVSDRSQKSQSALAQKQNVTSRPKTQQTQSGRVNQNNSNRAKDQKPLVSHSSAKQNRPVQTQQRTVTSHYTKPKISTTNTQNPRSNYRMANRSIEAGKTRLDPKTRSTYSNNNTAHHSSSSINYNYNKTYMDSRSHHYYPARRVKMHVHPVTYHNHYRVMYYPGHRDIIWTGYMHNYYNDIYPGYAWSYPIGYHIQTISAFEASYNVGEVSRVYGRVYATWYNRDTDDLLLFFGGEFPNQEFTLVVPGKIARKYSWKPERYFLGQHIAATGLITSFEGKAEMLIKRKNQIDLY